jgi:hypothetical protein
MEPTTEQVEALLVEGRRLVGVDALCPAPLTGMIARAVARRAYKAGADDQLQRCAQWLYENAPEFGVRMELEMREKPPTLAQACVALNALIPEYVRGDNPHINTLAAFLNSLPYE